MAIGDIAVPVLLGLINRKAVLFSNGKNEKSYFKKESINAWPDL